MADKVVTLRVQTAKMSKKVTRTYNFRDAERDAVFEGLNRFPYIEKIVFNFPRGGTDPSYRQPPTCHGDLTVKGSVVAGHQLLTTTLTLNGDVVEGFNITVRVWSGGVKEEQLAKSASVCAVTSEVIPGFSEFKVEMEVEQLARVYAKEP